jgi:hypothetical protein
MADRLQTKGTTHIDEINISSGLSSRAIGAAIPNLEWRGVVASLPGKRHKLL